MTFKSNLNELRAYKGSAPKENKDKIQKVIDLYSQKKIVNYKTAFNAVMRLASKSKHTIKSGRPDKAYDNIVAKYSEAEPMIGRLERERSRKSEEYHPYSATLLLFRQEADDEHDSKLTVDVPTSSKEDKEKVRRSSQRKNMFRGLRQFYPSTSDSPTPS